MKQIDLKSGRSVITLKYDETAVEVLGGGPSREPLSDAQSGKWFDRPIGSPSVEDLINAGDSVLIVVPDATRQTACGQMVNLVVRRLISNGTAAHDIKIIFATGIHRQVTESEKLEILTPFISQRINTINHDPRDLARIVRLGETSSGIPIELDRALKDFDKVITIGGVAFHYFAGFTGGRKLICPGLASARTISETHKLAFDCSSRSRRNGVGSGLLDGNAVHEAFIEAVSRLAPTFSINTIVNEAGEAVGLYCGDWSESHRAACEAYSEDHTIAIKEKRDLVIVSCGGFPHDIDLIQAHKSLEAASEACQDGGTIVFLAECEDGLGRSDLMKWFDAGNSDALASALCEKYQVNGQTAWSLLKKAERFDIRMITNLSELELAKTCITKLDSDRLSTLVSGRSGYIMPNGARFKVISDATA